MAKLKSFEEYVADIDTAEEIENTEVEMGEPMEAEGEEEVVTDEQGEDNVEVKDNVEGEEAGEEAEELEADTKEVSSEEDKGIVDSADDEAPSEEDAMTESEDSDDEDEDDSDDEDEDDSDDEDEDDSDDEDEDDSDDGDSVEVVAVAEMLKEAYKACKNEAKVWEEDMHDEHTIESYLKENAALVAMMAVNTLKEMKEDMTLEMYEATCNELKESYAKKIDEMKEAWSAEGEEVESDEE